MPVILKHKSISLLLITTFFMVGLFLSYYIIPEIVENKLSDNIVMENETSAFEPVETGQLERQIFDFTALLSTENYFEKSWNWQDNLIEAKVVNTSPLAIQISKPSSLGQTVIEKFSCPNDSTIAINKNTEIIGKGFEIEARAQVENIIWAYCLDEECSTLGKKCYLGEK